MGKSNRAQIDVVEDSGISSEVFDFTHILSSVSEGSQKSKAATEDHEKDLNISNVLATIRDDGPAVLRDKNAGLDIPPNTQKKVSYKQTSAPVEPAPKLMEVTTNTDKPAMVKEQVASAQLKAPAVSFVHKLLSSLLIIAVCAGAYVLYEFSLWKTDSDAAQQERETQLNTLMQRIETLETTVGKSSIILNLKINDLKKIEEQHKSIVGELQREVEELRLAMQELNKQSERNQAKPKPLEKKVQKPPVAIVQEKTWAVNLVTLASKKDMLRIQKKYIKQGIDAEIALIQSKGRKLYRLSKNGFSSKNSAMEYRNKVAKKLKLKDAWISKEHL